MTLARRVAIDGARRRRHRSRARRRRCGPPRWGPVVVVPRAGLNWTAKTAYALQDANAGNTRCVATLGGHQPRPQRAGHAPGAWPTWASPWVNTIAADRHGNAMYADVSVVPDVDAAQLERCAPSTPAAALRGPAGLIVLDGSKSDCDWRRDPASPVPGLTPIERMPVAIRGDWVHNSNDSFVYTHPAQRFDAISPMVGDASCARPRTRAGPDRDPRTAGARQGHAGGGAGSSCSQNRNFDGRRGAARPAGRLQGRPAGAPSAARPARRLRCAARLGPQQQRRRARRAPVPRVLAHGARRCPASTGCRSTRPSRWPRRPA